MPKPLLIKGEFANKTTKKTTLAYLWEFGI